MPPGDGTRNGATTSSEGLFRGFFGTFRYSGRALRLVWTTSRGLAIALAALSLVAGLAPAGIAYVGKLIVDAVVFARKTGVADDAWTAIGWVGLEAGLIVGLAAAQRGLSICQSLLRALMGNRINVMILEKALTLDLAHFEDSDFYDRLTRARREASSRPLSLVMRTFGLAQNGVSLLSYGALLLSFSPLAALVLVVAALPVFVAETKYSGEAFRLFRWRTPESRERMYLEMVLAREDHAKEVKVFELGSHFLARYWAIFRRLFAEDRSLTLRRGIWGYLLGLLSTLAFYGAYVWIVIATVGKVISLGSMTMYVLVFKQGQSALAASLTAIGGMYEDNLYLSNLYEYLEAEVTAKTGAALAGDESGDGIRFEEVSFSYPGSETTAVTQVSFHLAPGRKLALVGENGSGKTTLIKLLTRLYEPTAGRILLDGTDLKDWDVTALRRRVGVIFQDFIHYQMQVGENIGAGDADAFDDEQRWADAAEKGMAAPFIKQWAAGYHTQLGRWFREGRELSQGQWQKIALARAFMRRDADILVLDEPTAAIDAEAEAMIFARLREVASDQMAILISHRFSTVRDADQILVLHEGRVMENGTHQELTAADGVYARLFSLQAAGYR